MEISISFGSRRYIFHSDVDVAYATEIYAHTFGALDDFETALEAAKINYCYDIYDIY